MKKIKEMLLLGMENLCFMLKIAIFISTKLVIVLLLE